eukprot:GHVU01082346.1.p1 GENE.GHVU01082346.1~~GHVU01082346.1.p1  ORF type:complete len:100 (+),score=9.72 GHVU01082346.1:321-620(+)
MHIGSIPLLGHLKRRRGGTATIPTRSYSSAFPPPRRCFSVEGQLGPADRLVAEHVRSTIIALPDIYQGEVPDGRVNIPTAPGAIGLDGENDLGHATIFC